MKFVASILLLLLAGCATTTNKRFGVVVVPSHSLTWENTNSYLFAVQQSPDLSQWQKLGITSGSSWVIDFKQPQSFYRLDLFSVTNVILAWNPSPDNTVTGYNLHYGSMSGIYTNTINAGLNTNVMLNNLVRGSNYYVVSTAYNAAGLESPPSNELFFAVPSLNLKVKLAIK